MTATSKFQLSKHDKLRVSKLTEELRGSWKKSVESIFETGRCLQELKALLPRKQFISHIHVTIGISEKHAMRIIAVHLKFGTCKNHNLLKTKPTVLYQLAYTCTDRQLAAIKNDLPVPTANGEKSVSELKVRDLLMSKKTKKFDLERELATFFEETQDEVFKFQRLITKRKALSRRTALKETAKETMECLRKLHSAL